MQCLKLILACTTFIFLCANAHASASNAKTNTQGQKIKNQAEFQQVIEEYKAYVAKVTPKLREEIISYRKEIAKMNKEKRLLFRKLSQNAQDYLKKEQEFKDRLPLKKKNLVELSSKK